MGLPKLIQTLQPFAERVILGRSNSTNYHDRKGICNGRESPRPDPSTPSISSVAIDGPSLVYHVYHRLLSLKAQAQAQSQAQSHPLLSQPTYPELNRAISSLLTSLQLTHGIDIQHIYFDGGLPAAKREVRLARLEEGRRKLVEFRRRRGGDVGFWSVRGLDGWEGGGDDLCYGVGVGGARDVGEGGRKGEGGGVHVSIGAGIASSTKQEHAIDAASLPPFLLLPPPPLPPTLKLPLPPPPPFMVAAAIEHLRSHHHPPPTNHAIPTSNPTSIPIPIQLVPAEADTHCALHARRTGAAVLTSDSDLLAYDLGTDGSVVFWDSLDLVVSARDLGREGDGDGDGDGGGGEVPILLGTRYHSPSLSSRLNLPLTNSGSSSDSGTPLQRLCFERSLDPAVSTLDLKRRCGLARLSANTDTNKDKRKERQYADFLRLYSLDLDLDLDGDGEGDGDTISSLAEEGAVRGVVQGPKQGQKQGQGQVRHVKLLQGLDPRLAELVVQFQSLPLHLHPRLLHLPSSPKRGTAPLSLQTSNDVDDDDDPDPDDHRRDDDRDGHRKQEQERGNEDTDLHIYLPPLVEDPSRDPAWSYGQEVRLLAYVLLGRGFVSAALSEKGKEREREKEKVCSCRIIEYYRRGQRIVGVPVLDLPVSIPASCSCSCSCSSEREDLKTQIHSLLDTLHSHKPRSQFSSSSSFSSNPAPLHTSSAANPITTLFWRSFALDTVSEQRTGAGKAAPSSAWAERYLGKSGYAPTSWDEVHDQACVEAVLYSLRMLKQTTQLVIAVAFGEVDHVHHVDMGIRELLELLESLPSIPDLMRQWERSTDTNMASSSRNAKLASQVPHPAVGPDAQPNFNTGDVNGDKSKHRSLDPGGHTIRINQYQRRWKRARGEGRTVYSQQGREKDESITKKKSATRTGGGLRRDRNRFTALTEVEG